MNKVIEKFKKNLKTIPKTKYFISGSFLKNGGYIRKMQTASGGPITRYETLPNIEVVGYRPIELRTYKPLHKEYPFTGHSSLDIPIDEDSAYTQGWNSPYGISVDKTSKSKDYNLVTNNCADATLGALNYIFGTKEKPLLFTTPGDVRDYAINKLHGKVTRDKDGIDTILIPRNKNNAKKISKRALEWRKNKDDETIYEFEYKNGGQIRKMQTASGGPLYLSVEDIKNGANALGSAFLRGLGTVGKFLNAGFTSPTYGTTGQVSYARNALDAKRQRELSEASEQAMGKAMTWVSPLNYGAALLTGNGLNAKKGGEEIEKLEPWQQALLRGTELYVGPKGIKGTTKLATKATKAGAKTAVNMAAKAGNKTAKKAVVARKINEAVKKGVNKEVLLDLLAKDLTGTTSQVKIKELYPEFEDAMNNSSYIFGRQSYQPTGSGKWKTVIKYKDAPVENYMSLFEYPLLIKNGLLTTNRPIWLNKNRPYFGTPSRDNYSNSANYTYVVDAKKFTPELDLLRDIGSAHYEYPGTNALPIEVTKRILFDPILGQYTSTRFVDTPKLTGLPSTSLAFFERKPTKNNIVGAFLDYSMKDPNGINYLKLFFAQLKINGKEYTLEGLKDAANVKQGLPEHIQSYLNLNTVERAVRAMRKNGYSEREIQLYIDKVNEVMNKVKVGMYSDLEYNAAGALNFGGFYNSDLNFISVNKDAYLSKPNFTPNYILKHEGRHLIDYNTSMTDDVINVLEKAYDKDFLEIPKHEDAGSLKDYLHMDRERVTTNRDARDVLLSNLEKHPGEFLNLTKFAQTSFGKNKDMLDFLNKIIKYALPEDIVNAVENSNGYGKRYINYLKKNNKLTPAKIEQLRLAMIYVPSYLLPIAGGYTLYNLFNQPLQQLQYLKQGGKMNIIKLFKDGGLIRKMQTASGGPILWLRKRLYNNIEPFGYNDVSSRLIDAVVLNKNEHNNFKGDYSDTEKAPALYLTIDNIWGEYLHIPEKERKYYNGKYKIKNNGNGTFSLPFKSMEDIMQSVNSNNPLLWGLRGKLGNSVVGEYDVHRGYDKNGDYLKYIDHWRINPYDVKEGKDYGLDNNSLLKWYFKDKDDASFGLGTPVEIQGKYYLDDIYNVKGKDRGGHYLPEIIVTGKKKQGGKMNILEFLKKGSGIHIKKENRGKFTSYCGGTVTDECIRRGKNSSSATIRKRATFAANARKWKHKEGGIIKAANGINFGTAMNIGQSVLGLANSIKSAKVLSDRNDALLKAAKALDKVTTQLKRNLIYDLIKNLMGDERSSLVRDHTAYLIANNVGETLSNYERVQAELGNQPSPYSGIVDSIGGITSNILNNPKLFSKTNNISTNIKNNISDNTKNNIVDNRLYYLPKLKDKVY